MSEVDAKAWDDLRATLLGRKQLAILIEPNPELHGACHDHGHLMTNPGPFAYGGVSERWWPGELAAAAARLLARLETTP